MEKSTTTAPPPLSFWQLLLLGFVLGFFLSTAIFAFWFLQRNKPLTYQYVSKPMSVVSPVSAAPSLINNQQAVKGVAKSRLLDINQASLGELDRLPGIGAVRSQKIVDNRPYQKIEDLIIKKIIPRSVFEQIKDKITIGN